MSRGTRITTDVEYVANVLNNGGIAGIPTETVYGLGARADIEQSVFRIFDVKGRPRNHPLIAHLGVEVDFREWGQFNENAQRLAEEFWPGPLTLLVPRTEKIGTWVTGGRESVALRIPRHLVTLRLLSLVDGAIVAPSANRFGKVSPTTAQHVADDLGDDVDCILDGGRCEYGLESTIVECIGETVSILRPGAISALDISETLDLPVSLEIGDSRAPGMMISHYAPDANVRLVTSHDEAQSLQEELHQQSVSSEVLWFDDPMEYAVHLYDFFRKCDFEGKQVVIAILPKDSGIGSAVRDRLFKAAAHR